MTPMLFMGNSPAPYANFVHDVPKSQYELSNLVYGAKESIGDLELYPFTLDVENKSEYFLSYWSIDIYPHGVDHYVNGVAAFKILTPYYDEDCIKPSETMTVSGYALEQFPLDQLQGDTAYGYSADGVSVNYEGLTLENKYIDYTSTLYYKKTVRYDFRFNSIEYEQENGYFYSMMVEYVINGHTHYHFERNISNYLSIYSFEDTDDIEIKNLSVIREPYNYYHYDWDLDGFFRNLGVVCLVFLGVLAGIGWIISSIIVLVKRPWRRKDES